jgi:hypothetical protein
LNPWLLNPIPPIKVGMIPISPRDPAFEEKRYWRLPVPAAAIFAALIPRLQYDSSDCEGIVLANKILTVLMLKRYDMDDGAGGSGGDGLSGGRGGGGRGGGGGSSGGGKRQSKRKNAGGKSSASAQKHKKKARKVAGGDGAGDCGEPSDTNGEALCSFRVPLRPFWNADFPPGVRSQSDRREIASSTRTHGDNALAKSIDTNWDNSDSEIGRSEHS